jgi:hypothetical protein
MSDVVTNAFLEGQALGDIDYNSDSFRCALLHIIPRPADSYFVGISAYGQLSAYEVPNGNGYETYGASVVTSAYSDPATNEIVYACSSPEWIASAGDIGPFNYAAFYDTTANNSVIYVYDFLKDYTANDGGVVKISVDSNGLIRGKRSCS